MRFPAGSTGPRRALGTRTSVRDGAGPSTGRAGTDGWGAGAGDTPIGNDERMIVVGLVFAVVAALVHCFIFYLESIAWTSPRSRETFGTTEETAEVTRSLAFNQGFYNLFLAIAVLLGVGLFGAQRPVGATLVLVGVGSMLAAALVLALSDRTKLRAAAIQGVPPLLAVLGLAIGLASA